jgi:hypothetical protein
MALIAGDKYRYNRVLYVATDRGMLIELLSLNFLVEVDIWRKNETS